MGEKINVDDGKVSTTGTTTTTGTGGTGTGTTTGTKEIKSNNVPKPIILKSPNETDEEFEKRQKRNEQRRERYAKQKETKVKVSKSDSQQVEQIATLLYTLSNVVASKDCLSPLALTLDESKTIAQPLYNLMKDNEQFTKVCENSKGIPLVIACVTVMLPKIIATSVLLKAEKQKKEVTKNVRKNIGGNTRENGNDGRTVGEPNQSSNKSITNNATMSSSTLDSIGSPI